MSRELALLYNRRKRLAAQEEAERQGADFWTRSFDTPSRIKIVYAFRDAAGQSLGECAAWARDLILRDEGLAFLAAPATEASADFIAYIEASTQSDTRAYRKRRGGWLRCWQAARERG